MGAVAGTEPWCFMHFSSSCFLLALGPQQEYKEYRHEYKGREEGKYTASTAFTKNFEELENMPAITLSVILEIIHSSRIKYMPQYLHYSPLQEKNKHSF